MPVARQDLMRSVYRRYFTLPGKLFPKLVGARDLTKEVLDQWYTLLQPVLRVPALLGVLPLRHRHRRDHDGGQGDHGRRRPRAEVHATRSSARCTGSATTSACPGPALADTLEGLEEDVKEETGADVRFPLDEKGAEVLLVTPSADFFAEPHVDSLIGYAKVFHAAGIRWTLSSHASEAGNFGLFIGNYDQLQKIALRIREAALELGVKRIVVGECGHAWRVAYSFWNTLTGIGAGGDDPFARMLQQPARFALPAADAHLRADLGPDPARRAHVRQGSQRPPRRHVPRLVQRRARLAHGRHAGRPVRDPARASSARSPTSTSRWRRGTTREQTFCCGGGGGLLTDELLDLRVKGALPRMEALQQVVDTHGVNFMATICAICKAQFTKVLPYYGFKMGMVGGVHQLVSTAIRLGAKH